MEDVVENSEVRKAFDLKFNLSSSSLYVKLLQNIKYTFLEKKKKEREGRDKGEKIKFVWKGKEHEQGLVLLQLSDLLFCHYWLCIG